MKKLIGLLLYGLIIFGMSAGVGWFLKGQSTPQVVDNQSNPPSSELSATKLAPPTSAFGDPPLDDTAGTDDQMPVAARPESMTVEEIVRYGLNLKERDRVIREREEALQRLERQQRMVLADIQGEQQEVEGLLIQARNQRQAAEELLKQLAARKQEVDAAKQQMKSDNARNVAPSAAQPDASSSANLKTRSELLEGLSPEVAAGIIKEWAENGQTDVAAQMLVIMEQRNAAAIIEAIGDEKLIAELVGSVQALKPAPRAATRR